MDVIRCDEPNYLVWKWSPAGQPSKKENAIRYGSPLRVKAGEVAVFFYRQKDGTMQDYIEGPQDVTIKTANFPVLTSIVGAAFGGNTPFQAEVYFINLAGAEQVPFFIDQFYVTDPRCQDVAVPMTAKGVITFGISDYKDFILKHQLKSIDADDLRDEVRSTVKSIVKSAILAAPHQNNIPVTMIENALDVINRIAQANLKEALTTYGIDVKRVDISDITINRDSEEFKLLKDITIDQTQQKIHADTQAYVKNMADMQAIGAENTAESMRITREETQRQQRLQTESNFIAAHQLNLQADVAKTAATSLGQMGASMDLGGGGGLNPAGMMAGMMMGGVVGNNMANMMGSAMQGMNQPQPPQPPTGAIAQYHVAVNGQQSGPYTLDQVKQMVTTGRIQPTSYMWKPGMGAWDAANRIPEVASLFGSVPPPLPPDVSQTPPPPPAF